jgi:hypothetical protein
MEGSENDAQDTRPLVQTLFRLLHAGARSITGAHHAPNGFEGQNFMTLENILLGSGDIGAMLSTAWGVRQVDGSRTALYVQNVKPRDFQPCSPFIIEGRPHLDNTGHFFMIHVSRVRYQIGSKGNITVAAVGRSCLRDVGGTSAGESKRGFDGSWRSNIVRIAEPDRAMNDLMERKGASCEASQLTQKRDQPLS